MILEFIFKLYTAFNKFMIRFVFTFTWYQAKLFIVSNHKSNQVCTVPMLVEIIMIIIH